MRYGSRCSPSTGKTGGRRPPATEALQQIKKEIEMKSLRNERSECRRMKKWLMLFLGLFVITSASAQMCEFDITTCTFDSYRRSSNHEGGSNAGFWSAHNSNNTACSVSGMVMCSTESGTSGTAIAGSPSIWNGINCWCAMTSPRAGRWVFMHAYGTAADCAINCAFYCGSRVRSFSTYRAAILALP